MAETSERTALYRFFGRDDELLYVGITNDFGRRWQEHAQAQPWWPLVQRQNLEWYESTKAASAAERSAIEQERPAYNKMNNPAPPERVVGIGGARYRDIANQIRARISSGELSPGTQLPPRLRLVAQFNSALNTVAAAIRLLEQEGYVESVQGAGTFVREREHWAPGADTADDKKLLPAILDLERRIARLEQIRDAERAASKAAARGSAT